MPECRRELGLCSCDDCVDWTRDDEWEPPEWDACDYEGDG